jgi:phage/plasmid-like protein (TIGR03299 family)
VAHNLWIRNGQAAMFYVGDEPWHGLGVRLPAPPTAEEAIEAAGLDWQVAKAPLYVFGKSRLIPFPGKFAVVPQDRLGEDDCPIFGMVSEQYQPLQNREAFAFFDPLVQTGAATYHTAGALGRGERIWVLARLEGVLNIAGRDEVHKYVLLSNSHDGHSCIQVKITPVRVVCQNTLIQALRRGETLRVPHVADVQDRLEEARRLLGIMDRAFGDLQRRFEAMARLRLDTARLGGYLRTVFPDPEGEKDDQTRKRAQSDRLWAEYFFASGRGNNAPRVKGTLWAAYNGIVELVDHCDRRRMPVEGPDERRLQSAWFGGGYQVKARAFAEAERLLAA